MTTHSILLVGATGFIGGHLLAALQAEGHVIHATTRGLPGPELPNVQWHYLDLSRLADASENSAFAWPAGVDIVINAAGLLSADTALTHRVQDRGARALFDLALACGARVLNISALGAGEQAQDAFLASKASADDYLLHNHARAVVLRPSLVLGPGGASSRWLAALSAWPVSALPDLSARSQPLHIADLVGAVLALLRDWTAQSCILPVVGPQALTMPQVLNQLRAAQHWRPAHFLKMPAGLLTLLVWLASRFTRLPCRAMLSLASRDNLGSGEPLQTACGYRVAALNSRLSLGRTQGWPTPLHSVTLNLRPLFIAALVFIWLSTAVVCLGPGYAWGLRIMSEAQIYGVWASGAVVGGALVDGALGIGLLLPRWRRLALVVQLFLMVGYTAYISCVLPHYWLDPYGAVTKNLVLIVVTLWLWATEPRLPRPYP